MLTYPHFDPVIFRIGPLALRWYGLMYLLGFGAAFLLVKARLKRTCPQAKPDNVENIMFWAMLGLIVGARLGELLFYHWDNWGYYLHNPLEIIAVWHGGMSFHGGLIGASLAGWLAVRRMGLPILPVVDAAMLAAPVGLMLGRLGNFINGELWGRVTDVPWAMVFPGAGPLPRHPSQLYEAFLEGPLLLLILWLARDRVRPGGVAALFVIVYSLLRFLVEFVREPDANLGLVISFLTMGQLLCLAQAAVGALFWRWAEKRRP